MDLKLPDLELIEERFWDELKEKVESFEKNYYQPFFEVYVFPQEWTGLLSDGRTKYTTVVKTKGEWWGVFFEDKLAYVIHKPNKTFYESLNRRHMNCTSDRFVYY